MLLTFNISCDIAYIRSDFIIFNLEQVIYENPTVTYIYIYIYYSKVLWAINGFEKDSSLLI